MCATLLRAEGLTVIYSVNLVIYSDLGGGQLVNILGTVVICRVIWLIYGYPWRHLRLRAGRPVFLMVLTLETPDLRMLIPVWFDGLMGVRGACTPVSSTHSHTRAVLHLSPVRCKQP